MDVSNPNWINELWVNGKLLQSAWLAGFLGNLAASGVYDIVKVGFKNVIQDRRSIWRDAEDLANTDLLRALRLAEIDAMLAVCETCLLEDYDTDPSLLRTLVTPAKWRAISKSFSNPDVDAVLLLRSELLAAYRQVTKLSASELQHDLTLAVKDANELVKTASELPKFSSTDELKQWATAEFEAGLRVLLQDRFKIPLPVQLFRRLRLHWFDYMRVSFRRQLIKNPAAQHAFEMDVLSMIPELSKDVKFTYETLSDQLGVQDRKLDDIFDFLRLALGKREEQLRDMPAVSEDIGKLVAMAEATFKQLVSEKVVENTRHAEQVAQLIAIRAATDRAADTAERQLELMEGNRPDELNIAGYREAIKARYRHLRLETLSADQLYYQDIELQAVFIPQHVRNCQQWLPRALEGPKELGRVDLKDAVALVEIKDIADFRRQKPRRVMDVVRASDKRLLVLLGDPGAGKSSLSVMMLLNWATGGFDADSLPILIELRQYHRAGESKDFLEYLQDGVDLFHRFPVAELKARISLPGVTLIFDGLDEVFEPEARARVLEQICRYAREFPKTRILVTSRLVGYPPRVLRDAGFEHWLLQDFTPAQIADFLERWCSVAVRSELDKHRVKQRVNGAIAVPAVREMAGNPLLLTMMAMLARQRDLPRDQAGLYAKCAELLLELWDTQKALAEHVDLRDAYLDLQDKQIILRRQAWQMQTGQLGLRGNLVPRGVVEDVMNGALVRIEDGGRRRRVVRLLIDQLRERNFVLCHLGGEHYAYVHRGFLEYFCAEDIRNRFESERSLSEEELAEIFKKNCNEDAWKEVLVLAANTLDPKVADRILKLLLTVATPSRPAPADLVYSTLLRARDPQALVETRQAAWEFFERGTRAIKGKFRNRCLRSLVEHWSDERTRVLLEDIASQATKSTRARAIEGLAKKWPDERTRNFLQELSLSSTESKIGLAALRGLIRAWAGDTKTIDKFLITIATRSGHSRARAFALEHLARDKRANIREVLEEIARDDHDGTNRAVPTLAKFWHDDRTRLLLTEIVENNLNTHSARQALQALAQLWRDDATKELLVRLASQDQDSIATIEAIALLGALWLEEEIQQILLKIALGHHARTARVQALAMLASRWPTSIQKSGLLDEILRTEEGRSLIKAASVARYTLGPARKYLKQLTESQK